MSKLRIILSVVAILILSTSAFAQATRTWVSGVGDDVNPCSRTAPCKTFAGAISKTATGGIINALDSAGFGTLTINKAITVDATPFMGGMLAGGVPGVTINAPATADVFLRGLDIEGTGGGTRGIRILAAGRVNIANCRVAQFVQRGISVETSAAVTVEITNTVVHGNTGDGIVFSPSAGTPANKGSITHSVIENNTGTGLFAQNGPRIHVSDSSIAMNGTGVRADATAGVTVVSLVRTIVAQNATGITTTGGANAFIRLEQMTLEDNLTAGFVISAGQINSYKDNYVEGNGPNTGGFVNVSADKQ